MGFSAPNFAFLDENFSVRQEDFPTISPTAQNLGGDSCGKLPLHPSHVPLLVTLDMSFIVTFYDDLCIYRAHVVSSVHCTNIICLR